MYDGFYKYLKKTSYVEYERHVNGLDVYSQVNLKSGLNQVYIYINMIAEYRKYKFRSPLRQRRCKVHKQ